MACFVKGFTDNTSAGNLQKLFQAETGAECNVRMDPRAGQWAEIVFDQNEDAKTAILKLDGRGGQLFVKWFISDGWIKVSDISKKVNERDLKDVFSQFGDVERAEVRQDGRKSNLGFGYVKYRHKGAAVKVEELVKKQLFLMGGSPRPIRVEFLGLSGRKPGSSTCTKTHVCKPGNLEFRFMNQLRKLQLKHEAEFQYLRQLQLQELRQLMMRQRRSYDQEFCKEADLKKMKAFLENKPVDHTATVQIQTQTQPILFSLFVKGFEHTSAKAQLLEVFGIYCRPTNQIGVELYAEGGTRWAQVIFTNKEDAEKCQRESHNRSGMYVKKYLEDGWLKVTGLGAGCSASDLREVFDVGSEIQQRLFASEGDYGEVEKPRVQRDARGNGLGYGFVKFMHRGAATKVVEFLQTHLVVVAGSARPLSAEFLEEEIMDPVRHSDGSFEDKNFCFDGLATAAHMCQPNTLEFEFANAWRQMQWQHTEEYSILTAKHSEEEAALTTKQCAVKRARERDTGKPRLRLAKAKLARKAGPKKQKI